MVVSEKRNDPDQAATNQNKLERARATQNDPQTNSNKQNKAKIPPLCVTNDIGKQQLIDLESV